MSTIKRTNLNQSQAEEYAYSEIVEAGDFIFLTFCAPAVGGSIEAQIHSVLDQMEQRLTAVGLALPSVVKIDVLMKDPWNIPAMEKVFKERFKGAYPARKTIATDFAVTGGDGSLGVQIDAIAYRK